MLANRCSLLSTEFVSNECTDAIPPPQTALWSIGQDRADYRYSGALEDERALHDVVEAALDSIARSCLAPPASDSFYFTHQRCVHSDIILR